jgi:hypothetical protein
VRQHAAFSGGSMVFAGFQFVPRIEPALIV